MVQAHPELQGTLASVQRLVLASRARSTVRRYMGAMERFVDECQEMGLEPPFVPASAGQVAAVLARVSDTKHLAPSTLGVFVAAIAWAHKIKGWPDPCEDPLVRAVVDGARRMAQHVVVRPSPLLPAQLQAVVAVLCAAEHPHNWQVATMLAVGYPAFLRFSELQALWWSDLSWGDAALMVRIRKSKTNQLGTREDVRPVPWFYGSIDVRYMLLRYATSLGLRSLPADDTLMWPWLDQTDGDEVEMVRPRPAYAILRAALRASGAEASRFTWHSCRAGAATGALLQYIPREMVMKLGGWTSDAMDRYQRPDVQARLDAVTSMLSHSVLAGVTPDDIEAVADDWPEQEHGDLVSYEDEDFSLERALEEGTLVWQDLVDSFPREIVQEPAGAVPAARAAAREAEQVAARADFARLQRGAGRGRGRAWGGTAAQRGDAEGRGMGGRSRARRVTVGGRGGGGRRVSRFRARARAGRARGRCSWLSVYDPTYAED